MTMKINFDSEPHSKRNTLLQQRHYLLKRVAEKDIEDQNIQEVGDPERFAYLQGIHEIERHLETLGYAGPEVDVGRYAQRCFREEDAEEQD